MDNDKEITIADLYPELTPEQQAEAEERLLRYLAVVRKIYDRLVETGEIDNVLLRIQWEKKNRKKQ
jgi:hypothetical protein